MPEPVKFFDKIADLVNTGPSLLTTAHEVLADSHEVRSGTLASISDADYRAHVEQTILNVANERLREPLTHMLADCLQAVRDEHEMMEGPEPANDTDFAWAKGLYHAVLTALEASDLPISGVMLQAIGPNSAKLVEAVLAIPVTDPKPVLARLGISPQAVTGLVAKLRKAAEKAEPAPAALEKVNVDPFAKLLREYIAAGGDRGDASEAAHYVLSGDPKLLESALAILEVFDAGDEAMLRKLAADMAVKDGSDALIRLSEAVTAETIQAPTKIDSIPVTIVASVSFPNHPQLNQTESAQHVIKNEGPTTVLIDPLSSHLAKQEATREAVVALCDLSSATETQVAEIIGVTRSVMLNCRNGKKSLELDDAQAARVREALGKYARIAEVLAAFNTVYP